MEVAVGAQTPGAPFEEGRCTNRVIALAVRQSDGDLNDALPEVSFGGFGGVPAFLPDFVSEEVLAGVEVGNATIERRLRIRGLVVGRQRTGRSPRQGSPERVAGAGVLGPAARVAISRYVVHALIVCGRRRERQEPANILACVAPSRTSDEVFVAALPHAVDEAVADLGSGPAWWAGARIQRSGESLSARIPWGKPGRAVKIDGHISGIRPGEGIVWNLERGAVLGHAEWWFEPYKTGTIVHVFLEAEPSGHIPRRRWASRLRQHRVAFRRGMNALKDHLETR